MGDGKVGYPQSAVGRLIAKCYHKEEYEFDRDVSTLVVLLGFLDDRADDRILCFKHDVVKAKGRDYWNKVAAAALDYRDKEIAASLE